MAAVGFVGKGVIIFLCFGAKCEVSDTKKDSNNTETWEMYPGKPPK